MQFRFILLVTLSSLATAEETWPKGHLLPLGSHKPPSVVIQEFTKENAPKPNEFFDKYVKHSKAAIFRGAMTESKAFDLWTDEYIRDNFGEMEVRLEAKHEKRHLPPIGEKYLGRDNLRHFIDNYHKSEENVYIVSDLPSKMYKDFGVIPSLGACGEMSRRIVEVNIWWSGGGTTSIIHKDAYHQINCLLNGTKYWKLIENKYEKDIYKFPEPEYEQGGYSTVNPHEVDLISQPNVANIEWSNFTIYAGDCLFLPKGYYHQVASIGTHNLAVSLLFGRFDGRESLDFSDCTDHTDYRTAKSLADFDVQLVWKGKGMMVMGRSDLEDQFRALLLNVTDTHQKEGKDVDFDAMNTMLEEVDEGEIMTGTGDISKAFQIMDRNGDGVLTNQEVKDLTLDELRLIGWEIDKYEPSNSYDFEYSIISIEHVWLTLQNCLRKYTILNRETWISHYKQLGGTEDFGDEVFSRLSGNKSEVATKDVSKSDIWFSLENWVKFWAPQYSALHNKPVKGEEAELHEWASENEQDDFEYDVKFERGMEGKEMEDLSLGTSRSKSDEL